MAFFLSDGSEGTVAGREDGVVRQGKDLLTIVFPGVGKGDDTAPHRAGKKGITHDGKRTGDFVELFGSCADFTVRDPIVKVAPSTKVCAPGQGSAAFA